MADLGDDRTIVKFPNREVPLPDEARTPYSRVLDQHGYGFIEGFSVVDLVDLQIVAIPDFERSVGQ